MMCSDWGPAACGLVKLYSTLDISTRIRPPFGDWCGSRKSETVILCRRIDMSTRLGCGALNLR
ncbi:hypothetical protein AG1IA_04280 [Rhizoctonia solani AG-1 IA]|uniref:Uncharacterized protein n=1 Tax=Thanatephorus cucumeris (strain AG1-IA) TaxID=983506 RepID=L8WY38_THACA|nr:hypothetical protein AG1IA_04280 [Rhizoctonia solani AG-1 IA]